MAESRALSQWEIDALLNQIPVAAGAAEGTPGSVAPTLSERAFARVIKTYDFRRPDKFSKEQWTTLQSMHEQFARLIGASFSSRLRTLVSVRLSSIDQGLYEEWQAQVPSQTVCYVLSMRPLPGNIVVEFNMDVASEVIDRLLGGTGVLIDRGRELGEVELGLLRSFGRAITHSLQEMWAQVQPVDPQVQDLGQDGSLIQVAAPTDVVLTVFFEVNVGSHLGAMSICIPYTVLEPIAAHLSAQVWITSGPRARISDAEHQVMTALLGRSMLDLAINLGGVDIPTRTIVDLREGDTFVLETRVGRPLEIRIGGQTRFRGLPGLVGNRVALQLSEVVQETRFGFTDRSKLRLDDLREPALALEPPAAPPAATTAPGWDE